MLRTMPSVLLTLAVSTITLQAQAGDWPAADPKDVASVDAIIAAIYDVISGPQGEERNWARFRSLMHPNAKLIPVHRGRDGTAWQSTWLTVDDYVERAGPGLVANGFFERELGRVEERFDHIVHLFSSYESRNTREGDVIARGINSFQLMYDGERWWVMNIMWQSVGPDAEIPAKYLNR